MRMVYDTLKYAKLLRKKGVNSKAADGFMTTLSKIEIFNLYSTHEVDSMLSESVQQVFDQQDKQLAEQRREFDKRMKSLEKYHEQQLRYNEQQLRDNKSELLTSRRWLIGTVITVGFSLAAYFSALIHYSH